MSTEWTFAKDDDEGELYGIENSGRILIGVFEREVSSEVSLTPEQAAKAAIDIIKVSTYAQDIDKIIECIQQHLTNDSYGQEIMTKITINLQKKKGD